MSQVPVPNIENELRAICSLTDKRLEWEEISRDRVEELERKLKEGQAVYNQTRDHCAYMGAIITDLERTRLQQESALDHVTEHQWLLSQDLIKERKRADDLEIRLEKQHLVNEALLRAIAQIGHSDTSSLNIQHVLLQNEWQRELISTLRSALNAREETVRYLQMALRGDSQDIGPECCWACDTESRPSEPTSPPTIQPIPNSNNCSNTPR
ncbi:hypothetical protein BDV38DRAFT_286477 [Aspergillus pseudotamarii]|uniref:Uncharacterized protein n=2 Tax=Aspergillus subgen. Circumdati TaxID=2720871 RepID=A0A5N6SJD1_ASPPS|nr:uncharacterized protein BDV38DRAFT_286477 [Aspergillus pseudotamarii]XP_031934138.1 uncharacterized protein BDV37DRAFT_289955 [Aspergillus pseudonomiae]KAE8133860.1 hypothetical protein BDV38DRAFT_286477 [Aspergillus pseudotamarii]KAE8396819.1 hypothetical protein BDV37DRAFT_289955 [Aspergillus pseudonomiae]